MNRKLIVADKIILGVDKNGSPEILENVSILIKNKKIETIAPTAQLRKKYPVEIIVDRCLKLLYLILSQHPPSKLV